MLKMLLPPVALLLTPAMANASGFNFLSIDHYCFMVTGAGDVVALNHLCPSRISPSASSAAEAASIPMVGQICDDFATWGEAQYHYIRGTAPKRLDGDNDGTACEELQNNRNRPFDDQDGSRVATYSSTRYAGVSIELYDVARRNLDGEFYLTVEAPGLGVFSTRSFSGKTEALQHMRDYYGFTQGL